MRNKTFDLPSNQMLEALSGVKQNNPSAVYREFAGCVVKNFCNRAIPQLSPAFTSCLLRRIQELADPAHNELISLQQFVSRLQYEAASVAVWGPKYPLHSYEDYHTIDSNLPHLLGPKIFLPRAVRASRDGLMEKVGFYIKECWNEEAGMAGCSKAATDMIRCLRSTSMRPDDIQVEVIAFLFALHSNPHRITTWLFIHLLSDTRAMSSLREEVDRAVDVTFGDLDTLLAATPQQLGPQSLPLLESAIIETLRLWHTAVSVREAVENVELRTKDNEPPLVAYPGDMVMANGYAINMSNQYFDDSATFKLDRFALSDMEGKKNRPGIVPVGNFGGGMHSVCFVLSYQA